MTEPEEERPGFFCPRCDREFPTMKAVEEHVDRAHPEMVETFILDDYEVDDG